MLPSYGQGRKWQFAELCDQSQKANQEPDKRLMKKAIEQTLKESIARQKMLAVEDISLDSSLEELDISSLDAISLVFDIEDQYGVEVPNEELKKLRTVQDIVEGVDQLLTAGV